MTYIQGLVPTTSTCCPSTPTERNIMNQIKKDQTVIAQRGAARLVQRPRVSVPIVQVVMEGQWCTIATGTEMDGIPAIDIELLNTVLTADDLESLAAVLKLWHKG